MIKQLSFLLLSTYVTLCAALSIPTPPSLQLPTQNTTSLAITPWPRTPFRISVPDAFLPVQMVIKDYGAPGPAAPLASKLLNRVAHNINRGGKQYDLMGNSTQTIEGVVVNFSDTGKGYGVIRLHAERIVRRLAELTKVHGAVGVSQAEIEVQYMPMGGFELEWRFE